jgi:RNA polymerase sigma-70 factor, ECF subfamily
MRRRAGATAGRRKGGRVPEHDRPARFEQAALPHLPAAYNLARRLTQNDHDAGDLIQEAYPRA